MDFNVENLKQLGAFVSGPVEKEITWTVVGENGEPVEYKFTTYVRRASCATFEREIRAYHDNREMVATRIASSICSKDGEPVLSYEQALELTDTLAAALFKAIVEVNPTAPKS